MSFDLAINNTRSSSLLKSSLLLWLLHVWPTDIMAQKGLHLKFSIGPGYTTEYKTLDKSGISVVTKNHAIGWGISDDFAIHVGEFEGLVNLKVDNHNFVNLDAMDSASAIGLKTAQSSRHQEHTVRCLLPRNGQNHQEREPEPALVGM